MDRGTESTWKTYEGFGRYRISDSGEVCDTKSESHLPVQINEDGYPVITLRGDDGRRKTLRIHRLVAILFVPNPDDKPEVNHKSGNKLDNHHGNLEWMTHAENIQHAWDNNLLKSTVERSEKLSKAHKGKRTGKENPKSTPVVLLNTGDVFESARLAAQKYGIDSGNLTRVCRKLYGCRSAGKHPETNEPLIWMYYDEFRDELPTAV